MSPKPTVLILAGGLATRMRPLTEKIPKSLLAIHDRPFIAYQLKLLRDQGWTRVVIATGYEGQQIEAACGDGRPWGMDITYSYDGDTRLGTGGAVRKALSQLTDPFVVMYGDSFLNVGYQPIWDAFLAAQNTARPSLALMTVFHNQGLYDQSNVDFRDGRLLTYSKRQRSATMDYIDWGLGVLRKSAFDAFADSVVFDLADVYEALGAKGLLQGYEVHQRFFEIGSFDGLAEFSTLVQPSDAL